METQTKNKKFWKPPSFEDFNLAIPNKKIKLDSEECQETTQIIPTEASEPKAISDLAVHSKKIEEVKKWIKHSFKEKAPILLVTGPAGSGKTTTVKVSAKEEGMLLKEWINPVDKTEFKTDSFLENEVYDKFNFSESKQIDKFEDFVFRTSRYNSLFEEMGKTIIVIEDIPNIFLWRPKLFHSFLEKYKSQGKCPIVFIITDDQNLKLSGLLFTANVKTKFSITNIKFNPVNQSCLVKNLKSLSQFYCNDKVSSQFLENISKNSNGDVRSATNDFLLFLRTNMQDLSLLPSKKSNKNSKKNDGLWAKSKPVSAKDSNTDFYQVLGRILYPKVMGEMESNCENPKRIFHHDVKKIAESWDSSFLSVLHENYLQTYGKLTDVVGGAECFSFCDILQRHKELEDYSGLVGVISLMLRNTEPKKSGFNPIKKSFQWKPASYSDEGEEFYGHQLSRWDVHLDLIPFLKILKKSDECGKKSSEYSVDEDEEEDDKDETEIEEFED